MQLQAAVQGVSCVPGRSMNEGRDAASASRCGRRSPPPLNLQAKDLQRLEISFIELNKERAKQKEWKKLIRDMVFQRGKIPLLLAVEAGNQSMVRELLSAQTAEQLKVCVLRVPCEALSYCVCMYLYRYATVHETRMDSTQILSLCASFARLLTVFL